MKNLNPISWFSFYLCLAFGVGILPLTAFSDSTSMGVLANAVKPLPYSKKELPIIVANSLDGAKYDHKTVNITINCYGFNAKSYGDSDVDPLAADSDILIMAEMGTNNFIFLYPAYKLFQELDMKARGKVYKCTASEILNGNNFEQCWEKKKAVTTNEISAAVNGKMLATTMLAALDKGDSPSNFDENRLQYRQIKYSDGDPLDVTALRPLKIVGKKVKVRDGKDGQGRAYTTLTFGITAAGASPRGGLELKKKMDQAGLFNYCDGAM